MIALIRGHKAFTNFKPLYTAWRWRRALCSSAGAYEQSAGLPGLRAAEPCSKYRS